jgi:DNA-binding response OmpR family regulator
MNILIVEDEKITRNLIKELIEKDYKVYEADSSHDCFNILLQNSIDLIILDIVLPGSDGIFICSQIRKKEKEYGNPLILMLTSKDSTEDLVAGIESGADDYLKKPFDNRELLSRIIALFRRKAGFSTIYKYEDIVIDTDKMVVKEKYEKIELSKKEYELLLYIVINRGIVLSREKLLEKIWGLSFYEGNRTVDTYMKQLRKKIKSLEENIISVRGFGYKLLNK